MGGQALFIESKREVVKIPVKLLRLYISLCKEIGRQPTLQGTKAFKEIFSKQKTR